MFDVNVEDVEDYTSTVNPTSNVDETNRENSVKRGKVVWHRKVFGDVLPKTFESGNDPISYHSDVEDVALEVYYMIYVRKQL